MQARFQRMTSPPLDGGFVKFLIVAMSFLFSALAFAQSSCPPANDSCNYYLCKASQLRCTDNDYPIRFGYRLCQRYLENQSRSSDRLQAWLPKVRLCLQQKFEQLKVSSCSSVEDAAFSTHVECYVQTGFCALTARDRAWLIYVTSWDMLHSEALRTAIAVDRACKR
jgi:hypothetical protein